MRAPRRRLVAPPVALAALLLAAADARAQLPVGSVTVTAAVTDAIDIKAQSATPMAFGTVYPGIAKGISWTDASAAAFEGRYRANAEVDVTFHFAPLSNGTGGSLVIEGLDGCWATTTAKPAACPAGQSFVPSAARTRVTISHASGRFWLYVGARVLPTSNQPAGAYSGSIQVTALTPTT